MIDMGYSFFSEDNKEEKAGVGKIGEAPIFSR